MMQIEDVRSENLGDKVARLTLSGAGLDYVAEAYLTQEQARTFAARLAHCAGISILVVTKDGELA